MDSYKVKKSGPLEGEVVISGAKNAVLPVLAATLLADGVSEITNVPRLKDVKTMCNVMRVLGMKIDSSPGALKLDSSNVTHLEAPYELVKTMRASIYVLGPLVARFGKARVSLPGGCAWGPRPVDLHIKGLEALGAKVEVTHGFIEASCDQLKGAEINFPISSVGATANILMATTLAEGTSVLNNAAMEPEITALCDYLIGMGAKISGVGTKTLVIQGVKMLRPGKGRTIPDRIEAGTFLVAGAITRGRVKILNAEPKDLQAVLQVLSQMGCKLDIGDDTVEIDARDCALKPTNVITNPHPAFPTDMQAQFMALLSTVEGTCIIQDNIYHDRFSHMSELQRLGADIMLNENIASINGGKPMSGAPVMASDLRASAALVLAGLVAAGTTEISRIYHMDRGYEYFEKKISKLGGIIERIKEEGQ